MWWREILVVGAGGAVGAILRLFISRSVGTVLPYAYPWGILVCNVLGSFAIGLVGGWLLHRVEPGVLWRAFLIIGILGGFTTFSSFSMDTVTLLRQGSVGVAFANIIASLVLCLSATGLGLYLVE